MSKLSTRIDDAELTHRWLVPLGAHRLQSRAIRRDFVSLVQKHGASWARALFSTWTEHRSWRTPEWVPALADVCEDLCATQRAPCEELAEWLLEHETTSALERCSLAVKQRPIWLALAGFSDEATHLAHVLAAAVAIAKLDIVERAIDFLLSEKLHGPLPLLVQVLQTSMARSPSLRAHMIGSPLHQVCAEQLEAILRTKTRAAGDWSIAHSLSCSCADCKDLFAFLHSRQQALDWPLNKERRRHIHNAIDAAKLPVSHATLRHGSPYVLQLRKEQTPFSCEAEYRKQVKVILRELPAVRSC